VAFVITETCIDTQDQACVDVCPVDCIHFEEGKDRMLYINPAECIDCGACQPACPVTAIFPEGDVPAAMARFTEINSLWYENPDAARAKVGGGGGAAPAREAAAPAAAEASGEAPAAEAAAAPVAAAAAPAPAPAAKAAPVAAVMQVPAVPTHGGSGVSAYRLPQASNVIMLAVLGAAFFAMFVFPGPTWIKLDWAAGAFKAIGIDNGGGVGITVALLAPLFPLLLIIQIALQFRDFGRFAASHERQRAKWRARSAEWRRNEESRRYELTETVQAIARDRFEYAPDTKLRTYVNLPEPTMGVEVRGTGDKVFPDIVTVAQGNQPVAIVQVESKETVTRDQAMYVWATLENRSCPLYVYVPAGLLGRAKDYATSVGLKNVKFRTWRWSPNGMVVKEA